MDTTTKVGPGEPLEIGAAVWNNVLDATADFLSRRGGRTGGEVGAAGYPATLVVTARNDTGGDLDRGAVLTPAGEILDATVQPLAVQRRPVFAGAAPAAVTDPVLILLEPVADGGIGRAVVAGVAVCDVNVTSGTHLWARPTAGNTARLESAADGPARVLWREAGSSGLKRAVVLLTGGSGSAGGGAAADALLARVDSQLGSPTNFTVHEQDDAALAGTPANTGSAFANVYVVGGSAVPNGAYVALVKVQTGHYFAIPAQAVAGDVNTYPGWVVVGDQHLGLGTKTIGHTSTYGLDVSSIDDADATYGGFARIYRDRVTKWLCVGAVSGTLPAPDAWESGGYLATNYPLTSYSAAFAKGVVVGDGTVGFVAAETTSTYGTGRLTNSGVTFSSGTSNDDVQFRRSGSPGSRYATIAGGSTGKCVLGSSAVASAGVYAKYCTTDGFSEQDGADSDGTATAGMIFWGGVYTGGGPGQVYDQAHVDALEARIATLEAFVAAITTKSVVDTIDFGTPSSTTTTVYAPP